MKFEFDENEALELADFIDNNKDACKILNDLVNVYSYLKGTDSGIEQGYTDPNHYENIIKDMPTQALVIMKNNYVNSLVDICKNVYSILKDNFDFYENDGYQFINEGDMGLLLDILSTYINKIDVLLESRELNNYGK